jgi:hypothetical protein
MIRNCNKNRYKPNFDVFLGAGKVGLADTMVPSTGIEPVFDA